MRIQVSLRFCGKKQPPGRKDAKGRYVRISPVFLHRMKARALVIFIFLTVKGICGTDTLLVTQLLQRMAQLQVKQDGVFPKGLFPSYREYQLNKDRQKADINGFFTGLIAFTLRDQLPQLTATQRELAEQLIRNTQPVYDLFKSKSGKPVYNFWPTNPPQIFPHSGWMNIFNKKQSLADDMDDTVIILLAMNAPDSTARKIHALMQAYINPGNRGINSTFKDYRQLGAYSTWFGSRMPVEFDVCVLANVLYFVQRYHLNWTAADSASVEMIEKIISSNKHKTATPFVSAYYGRLPVILYHLARLMSVAPIASLEKLKPKLIADAQEALLHTNDFMDQVILQTALMRWGVKPPAITLETQKSLTDLVEDGHFYFFNASIASLLPDPLRKWISKAGLVQFTYDCDAYNNLLLLENLVLSKNMQ